MTDGELVAKRLAFIETCLAELAHGYLEVDPAVVARAVAHQLGDLQAFVDQMRAGLVRRGG